MKETYKIDDILFAQCGLQTPVRTANRNGATRFFWNYDEKKIILVIKSVSGFKHILTGAKYQIASPKTAGEYVIKPSSLHEFCKVRPDLAKKMILKNKSHELTLDQISYLEDRLNNETDYDLKEICEFEI